MEQADYKAQRIIELRQGGAIEYHIKNRSEKALVTSFIDENLCPALMRMAMQAWLFGDKDRASNLFAEACEVSLNASADFLATCDVEAYDD